MELTRTDDVFSRIAMVLFLCRNKSSQNDLKLHGDYFWNKYKILAKESTRGDPHPVHKGGGRALWSCGSHEAPPTSTPTPYIHVQGEKNQREGFVVFYDTEPPPPPVLPWEGRSG